MKIGQNSLNFFTGAIHKPAGLKKSYSREVNRTKTIIVTQFRFCYIHF